MDASTWSNNRRRHRFSRRPIIALQLPGGSSKLFFSSDSRYLAYDLPTADRGNRRDVFVLATDGNHEIPAVVHPGNDVLMGWTPAGKRLLFTSDRAGSAGLWALAFIDGEPQGTPEQIKVDVTGDSMGLTSAGALTAIVERDLSSGNEKEVIRGSGRMALWDLSPDGKYLVVVEWDFFTGPPALPARAGKWRVLLAPPSGGEPWELMRGESQEAGVLMWAPDSRSIFVYSLKDRSTLDHEVWPVVIDGIEPQNLDLNVNSLGPLCCSDQRLRPHPDGKRVAFASVGPTKSDQVWALEDFLPPLNRSK